MGGHQIEAIFLPLFYFPVLRNCPWIEVKESFCPGVINSYLTLETPESVLLPFPGHSAGTIRVRHRVSSLVPREYPRGSGDMDGGHFVYEGAMSGHGEEE